MGKQQRTELTTTKRQNTLTKHTVKKKVEAAERENTKLQRGPTNELINVALIIVVVVIIPP